MRLLLILLLFIQVSLANDSINMSQFNQRFKNIMFDTTGAHLGSGDILGPLNLANELIKRNGATAKVTIIYDDYGYKYLKDIINSNEFGIDFIREDEAIKKSKKVDLLFSLFTPHREINESSISFENNVLRNNGYVFFGGSLHNSDGEVLKYNSEHATDLTKKLNFSTAGFGPSQAGIIWDPVVSSIAKLSKDEQRTWALKQLEGHELEELVLKIINNGDSLGIIYGAKNAESFDNTRPNEEPQFIKYLRYAQENTDPSKNAYILNPESPDVINDALNNIKAAPLTDNIKPITINRLKANEFMALAVLSDLPIGVEGDNSVSAIIKLKKKMMLLRSTWNGDVEENLEKLIKEVAPDSKTKMPFIDLPDDKLTKLSNSIGYWADYLMKRITFIDQNKELVSNNTHIDQVYKLSSKHECVRLFDNFSKNL